MVNMSIGGNAVFNGGIGPKGKDRFQHDVLDQPGIKWLVVAEGVNDIGNVTVANVPADARVRCLVIRVVKKTDQHSSALKDFGFVAQPCGGFVVHAEFVFADDYFPKLSSI